MSEKTEQPSPKRVRDAQKEGQYLISKEASSLAVLFSVTTALFLFRAPIADLLIHETEQVLTLALQPIDEALPSILRLVLLFTAVVSGVACGASIVAAVISGLAQTGLVFNAAKLKKGFQSLNVVNNAKQIFSKRNLFTLGLNLVKIIVIGTTVYLVVRAKLGDFVASLYCGLPCSMELVGEAFVWLLASVISVFVPIAVLDYLAQKHFYLKELRMSKDEVKQEFKETEGNPEIKGHRKQLHQEVLNSSMLDRVRKKATLVVKNPTHYAVALFHDDEEMPLPQVIGKGEGPLALEIIALAEREGIPVYENVLLAHGLYGEIEIGHNITSAFIAPVIEALRYVEMVKGERR